MSYQDDDNIQVRGDRNAIADSLGSVDFPYDEIDRGNPLAAIIGEDDVEDAYRSRAREEFDLVKLFVMSVMGYSGDRAIALDCGCLTLGYTDLAKAKTFKDIADRYSMTKQNISCIKSNFVLLENRKFVCESKNEDIIALAKEAYKKRNDFLKKFAMAIQDYRGDKSFALDCGCLALGLYHLASAKTQEELAKRYNCTKANVNRTVNAIQFAVGIEPLPGQRSAESRRKFSEVRKQQLKP